MMQSRIIKSALIAIMWVVFSAAIASVCYLFYELFLLTKDTPLGILPIKLGILPIGAIVVGIIAFILVSLICADFFRTEYFKKINI